MIKNIKSGKLVSNIKLFSFFYFMFVRNKTNIKREVIETTGVCTANNVTRPVTSLKYYVLVGGRGDKHMVEHEHFNQERAVQYYAK